MARTRIGTPAELISGVGQRQVEQPVSPLLCLESLDQVTVLLEEGVLAAMKERTT